MLFQAIKNHIITRFEKETSSTHFLIITVVMLVHNSQPNFISGAFFQHKDSVC